jgi:hypothetical protein
MGVSDNPQMLFNLNQLMVQHDLHDLITPFIRKEMDAVAKDLPNDKAPGPDGFNGHFFKKSWT